MKGKHIQIRIEQCLALARASNCPRRKFGALLLDPSRNVDVQFRRMNYVLHDGDIVSALPRREEGETIVVADEQGKERTLAKSAAR